MMYACPMSLSIVAETQVPFADRYCTPWMPLARCDTEIAGQYTCAPCRKPMLMSPL